MKRPVLKRIFFLLFVIITCPLFVSAQDSNVPDEQLPLSDEELPASSEEITLTPERIEETLELIKPVYDYDFSPEFTGEEVKERLKSINSKIELTYNEKVLGFVNYFVVRNREYSRMVLSRKNLYFKTFERKLAEHGLPDELKYLAIVESGLNPKAGSRVGAVGLWQFMPATGRLFKLKQDYYIDERMDPEKSTEAACMYLKELYSIYGDWQLALASYNCGPGTLRRAIRRSGYKGDFWDIYNKLPRETRSYVPQFVAITYLFNFAEQHNLVPEQMEYMMETDTIHLNKFTNLETFSNLSGICLEDINKLNPQIKRNAVPDYDYDYKLIIPADKKESLALNRISILDSASKTGAEIIKAAELAAKTSTTSGTSGKTKTYYTVKRGDVLGSIASKNRVGLSELKRWNNLRSNTIRVGQRLVIYKHGSSGSSSSYATKSKMNNQIYVVKPGDTLWHIIKKYDGLTVEQLKKKNNLKTNNIKPGQKLVIG